MEIYFLTLNQLLTMFFFIVCGYLLRKKNILPESSYLVMSRLETYFFVPALTLYSWMTNCTVNTLKENSVLVLSGALLIIGAISLAYPLSRLFVRKTDSAEQEYQRNIYRYAMTFGNYGFMGNYIVLGIWGNEMLFKYGMFTLFIGFACSMWGMYILIPKEKEGRQSLKDIMKRLFPPPVIAMFVGLIVGICNIKEHIPGFIIDALEDGGNCMGPVAMLLAGVVIGGYNLKELLTYKKVYVATLMRLVVIPACLVLILRFVGVNKEIMQLALIAFATPLGLNTIVYPAAYGGDVKTGAAMAIISHTLSVITIPLMYLIFIVML